MCILLWAANPGAQRILVVGRWLVPGRELNPDLEVHNGTRYPTELSAHLAQLVWRLLNAVRQNGQPGPVFGPSARPAIGLAQLNYTAALQPRRYPVGCVYFIMGSEPGCATNSRRWLVDIPLLESNTGPLGSFVGLRFKQTPNQLS